MKTMDATLQKIDKEVYKPCNLKITAFKNELESAAYHACQFQLNDLRIISRSSKITPKKIGQFVTFWKRDDNGPISPFNETDAIDYFIVNVKVDDKLGQFVFPTSILIKKGVLSTETKEGKRAFRVYPPWDVAISKQAIRTQKWQLAYFYEIGALVNFGLVKGLFGGVG